MQLKIGVKLSARRAGCPTEQPYDAELTARALELCKLNGWTVTDSLLQAVKILIKHQTGA